MKSNLIKSFLSVCIVLFINACHIFEHQNIFIENIKRNLKQELPVYENKNPKNIDNKSKNNEMAPIDLPKQKEKVQKLTLQKQVNVPNLSNFDLDQFKNWSEVKLINKLGKSDFIKEEGKLKNYQYYFKECFLDVYFVKTKNDYFVNYIEMRPTKLNGKINIKSCYKKISQTIK